MVIYQCIHKYDPHISMFEQHHGIGEHSSFKEIHGALLKDGYASVYRLMPGPNSLHDRVFFTVWNYERLQHKWAEEHGLATKNLDEIRIAQIEEVKADIVYDFSHFVSACFVRKLRRRFSGIIVAWNGYISKAEPPVDEAYDGFLSLHRPFVKSWVRRGYKAVELQPGIEKDWGCRPLKSFDARPDDLIMYGQLGRNFGKRAKLASDVVEVAEADGFRFKCYAGASKHYYPLGGRLARAGVDLPFLVKWPDKRLLAVMSPSVYGVELTQALLSTKAVLNNFTDLSIEFHSNMRIFEATGHGTVLLSPYGVYPEGLEAGVDYLPYSSITDIASIMERIRSEPDYAFQFAANAQRRVLRNFSKQRQYEEFGSFIEGL